MTAWHKFTQTALVAIVGFSVASGCAQVSTSNSEPREASFHRDHPLHLGVNAANLYFHYPGATDTAAQLMQRLEAVNLSVLRFPGGTSANFYHPKANGYGFKEGDQHSLDDGQVKQHVQKLISAEPSVLRKQGVEVNYIHSFASFAAESRSQVLYVANLLTGTVEETLYALEVLQAAGASIAGVELGNEYYLNAYASAFPSVDDYLKKAEQFSSAIKAHFPELSVSVVAAPSSVSKKLSAREREWNQSVAKAGFYDALSIHFYPMSAAGMSSMLVSDCSMQEALQMADAQFLDSMKEFKSLFGERPLWFTEWNVIAAPKWCNNGVEHAAFVMALLRNMQSDPQVVFSIYHSLISRGEGFNLFIARPSEPLQEQFNLLAFELFARLAKHSHGDIAQIRTQSVEAQTISWFYSADREVLAALHFNASEDAFTVPLPIAKLETVERISVIELTASGLAERSFVHATNSSSIEFPEMIPNSIRLTLFH